MRKAGGMLSISIAIAPVLEFHQMYFFPIFLFYGGPRRANGIAK
jgi:hypothetical protein